MVSPVRRALPSLLLLLVGAGILRVSLFSDLYLRYVKEGLQPFLVTSGVIVVCIGLLSGLRDFTPGSTGARPGASTYRGSGSPHKGAHQSSHQHSHSHTPRVAWLLLLPTLGLLFFAPPALGSYTAARDTDVVVEAYERFRPLPSGRPAPLSLTEFIARAQQDGKGSLAGREVVMQGFVTPRADDSWDLTRLLIACCAADSQSLTVTMHGAPSPRVDSWVRVTGTWHPEGELGTPTAALALDVAELTAIPAPSMPYLDRPPKS
ncbi:TIGR03943 family putative permease subunit [Streptomyces parvus]|uniref:TIGR03943 family putative permease subunit n=1 Tax=Streptomyces parvus TaxID=66428 RepID=UPI0038169227